MLKNHRCYFCSCNKKAMRLHARQCQVDVLRFGIVRQQRLQLELENRKEELDQVVARRIPSMPKPKPGRPGPKILIEKVLVRGIMKKKMQKFDIDFKLLWGTLNRSAMTEHDRETLLDPQELNFQKKLTEREQMV